MAAVRLRVASHGSCRREHHQLSAKKSKKKKYCLHWLYPLIHVRNSNCYKGVWQLVPGWDPRGLNTHRFSEGPLLRQGKSRSDCEIGTCMCTMPASRGGQNGSWPRGAGADAQPRAWRHDSGHVGTQRSWHKLVLRGLVSQRHMAAELFFSRMKGLGTVGPLTRLKEGHKDGIRWLDSAQCGMEVLGVICYGFADVYFSYTALFLKFPIP